MTVNTRLLFGSLAIAAAIVAGVSVAAATRNDKSGTVEDVTLTSNNDLVPPIGTNAALTGRSLPTVNVETLDGDAFSTADLVGRPLVVNFWYSTCAPCKRELPAFAAAHAMFGDRVRFVGVDSLAGANRDSEEAFARDRGVQYELMYDGNGELTSAVGIATSPQTLFIDARGTIVEQTGELTAAKLEDLIRTKLL